MRALIATSLALLALGVSPAPSGPTPPRATEGLLIQVAPQPSQPNTFERATSRDRAIVLIRGLGVHPISKDKVEQAIFVSWQKPGSRLVTKLAPLGDVYSFAYAQNSPVETIAERTGLPGHLRVLRQMGYREIVLVGHSAGALIARHLVEDHADTGVTKVIQVCPPNVGSTWAAIEVVRSNQVPFLESLSRSARRQLLADRADKRIPAKVQFVCVLGSGKLGGDGILTGRSQWSEDLQLQGVPVFLLRTSHWDAMMNTRAADLLARLVEESVPRWEETEVQRMKKILFND